MIGAIIYTALATNATVAALVGTRIYPEEAPADADLPLIVYTVRTAVSIDGTAPLLRCNVTANSYASTDATAESLGAAVRTALDGYSANDSGIGVRQLLLADTNELRDEDMGMWGRMAMFAGWIVKQ